MTLPYASSRWPVATTTLGLWALAAASVVFWGLRLAAPAALGGSFDGPTALTLQLPVRPMAIPAAPTPVTAGN
jgi:hypothetical protein